MEEIRIIIPEGLKLINSQAFPWSEFFTLLVAILGFAFNNKLAKDNNEANKELSEKLADKNAKQALELQKLIQEHEERMYVLTEKHKLYLEVADVIAVIPVNVPDEILNIEMTTTELRRIKKESIQDDVLFYYGDYPIQMAFFAIEITKGLEKLEEFDEKNSGRFYIYSSFEVFEEFCKYLDFLRNSNKILFSEELKNRSNNLIAIIRKELKVPDD